VNGAIFLQFSRKKTAVRSTGEQEGGRRRKSPKKYFFVLCRESHGGSHKISTDVLGTQAFAHGLFAEKFFFVNEPVLIEEFLFFVFLQNI
jgi:hypothetical protein